MLLLDIFSAYDSIRKSLQNQLQGLLALLVSLHVLIGNLFTDNIKE